MKTAQKFFQVCIILTLTFGLLTPPLMTSHATQPRMSALLAQMVAEDPNQRIRVTVQRAINSDQVERFVEKMGGHVLKDLPLINAFAAQIPAKSLPELAVMASVNWVYLDAPVKPTGKLDKGKSGNSSGTVTYSVRDEFNLPAYNNNDGTANWTSDWEEFDDNGDPTSGQIFVDRNQRLHLDNLDSGALESAQRIADLSGAVSAVLTFDYYGFGDGWMDTFAVEVSPDGLNFTTLGTADVIGIRSGSESYDLTGVVDFTTNVTIRFRLVQGFGYTNQFIAFDNIQIQYDEQVDTKLPQNFYLDTLGVRDVWAMGYTGAGIGVAVIDSGISNDADLRLTQRASFNQNSSTPNDVYGHGTHVAGIIAGNGASSGGEYKGIAPDVNLFSLKISDETGFAYESDTVEAMQWVYEHRGQHNIRVVNLSIQSTVEQSYHDSALCAAAEILWLNGIVVTAASGNWSGGNIDPLNVAPGSDPFVITVGAVDEKGSKRINDDQPTTFSAWGITQDGFLKPEIFAPGVNIISVLSKDSTWSTQYPERVVSINNKPQYFRISGTSMATPMVSAAVALLLEAEPTLTPDQVKYRVMNAINWAGSSPYLSIKKMLTTPTTESANQDIIPHMLLAKMAMIAYWANENGSENINWENVDWSAINWNAVNWNAVNWNAVNWNAVNWNAVNWNAVNWNAVNWNAVNWNAVNWNAVNWNAVNWNAVNWNAVSWED